MYAFCYLCKLNEKISEHVGKVTHKHDGEEHILQLSRYKITVPKGTKRRITYVIKKKKS